MRGRYSINSLGYFAAILTVIGATKLSSYLEPLNLYFRFSSLFAGTSVDFVPAALLIKLAIPFLSAFVLIAAATAFVRNGADRRPDEDSRYLYFLRHEATHSMQVGAFFAALLLAWPMIIHWNVLAAEAMHHRYASFLLIYFLYALAYLFLGGLGARVALRLSSRRIREAVGVEPLSKDGELVKSSALSAVFGSAASYALSAVAAP